MAALDKIRSGLPQMDEVLDYIRLGDNVVWQISNLEEFRTFAEPFARQAVQDGRNVIYIRFAQHEPVLRDLTGIQVRRFNPDEGFEAFTVAIHEEITRQGRDAFYVFDCLSELQSVWYADLMMGNFFRVTCPYLFELDTVAYFPLIRGRHSFDTVARIRDTTQLLLNVYSDEKSIYLHPMKVWNRYSEQMFLPHRLKKSTGEFSVVADGVGMSRFYQLQQRQNSQDQNFDSHDRFFSMAKMQYAQGCFTKETQDQIIRSTMTKDSRLKALVETYFRPEDYFTLRERMIGSGAIGGKACGMLLARKIVEAELPEYAEHDEPHDSFYIGSDVFYTYIVSNGDWKLRIRQCSPEGYFSAAQELREHLLNGVFPAKIRGRFVDVLEYFGQNPFIVRSSSFLEDGFGNAFAGKYESVFCVNQGSPDQRLEAFEQAVRQVYASTMDVSALEYRRMRGLDKKDEQMAILVQRVSGSYYGKYFMPCAAGVGYSHSAYKWMPDMDPGAGMLRIVMGLGTKAVDRTKEDYPRLANLDRPGVTMLTTVAQKHKFSQQNIDLLDCGRNQLAELPLDTLLSALPLWYKKIVLERDNEAEARLREIGRWREVWFVSCQKLLETESFTGLMQKILKTLERVYENPVDIEFAVNLDSEGDFVVNLLQCRPLYQSKAGEKVDLQSLKPRQVFFDIVDSAMGSSCKRRMDVVVQIDPVGYYQYPYQKKYQVVQAVEAVNDFYKGSGKHLLLMTPGRVGTSSPELGVPVSFRSISNFSAVCEVSDSRAGYMPELSYGSHVFQDLVEAQILYGAVYNDRRTRVYTSDLFQNLPDRFGQICPDCPELAGMIQVREVTGLYFWLDAISNHAICGYEK